MKRTLILIAGPPATGKSYLIAKMRKVIPDFFLITPDEVKEMFADKYGFESLYEKAKLEVSVWEFYYRILAEYMVAGKQVIVSEYPFSQKQKGQLSTMAAENDYHVLTIRLVADFDVLWQRRQVRDLEANRHLSHLMSHYHANDQLTNRSMADNQITKEAFVEIIAKRKYNEFQLGKLLEVDVSDFAKVDYQRLLAMIVELV